MIHAHTDATARTATPTDEETGAASNAPQTRSQTVGAARGRSTAGPRARARGAVTDAERAEVLALHADGLGRNAIASRSGVSRGSVTAIVSAAGGSFERSHTKMATEARAIDQRAERVQLARDFLADGQRIRDLLLVQLAKGDPRGVADAVKALSWITTAHLRLAETGPDEEIEDARSMLGDVAAAVSAAYQQLPAEQLAPSDDQDQA